MEKLKGVYSLSNNCKKTFRVTLLFLFVALICSTSAFAAVTYYVATTGNDSSAGSSSNPWSTVSYALTQVSTGDTIKVKAGTYSGWSGDFWADINTPAKHNNLTITADDPKNRPLIQGGEAKWGLIWIRDGVAGVTISYLRLAHSTDRINAWKNGVIQVKSNPATIDNNEIFNGFNGISIETNKNVTISNNLIYSMGKRGSCVPYQANGSGVGIGIYNFQNLPPATGWNEKIYIINNEIYDVAEDGVINVNTNFKYIEVAYNNIHDNWEDGVDWKDTQYVRIHHNQLHDNCGNGIGSNYSYPSSDFEIYSNKIYNNGTWGIMIQGSNQNNWKIYNNLIYNNCQNPNYSCFGAQLGGSGHEFYNNTVFDNESDSTESGGIYGTAIIKNNAFSNNGLGSYGNIASSVSGTIDSNYVYPMSPGITGTNATTDPDPKFTDVVNGDFTLQSDSPLINKGIDAGITDDYLGNSRPSYGGYDLGAHEYTVEIPQNLIKK